MVLSFYWRLYLFSTQKAKIEWSVKNGFFLALYIVAFSLAYLHIDAGVGHRRYLALFSSVWSVMVYVMVKKSICDAVLGCVLRLSGIFILLLPGADAPNLVYAAIMVLSGIGWAMYSIAGKNMQNPLASTLANFVMAIPFVLLAYAAFYAHSFTQPQGVLFGSAVRRFGPQVVPMCCGMSL